MNHEEAAEQIICTEGMRFTLAIADFAASHQSRLKAVNLRHARDALKQAIVNALEDAAREAEGKVTG